MKNKRNYLLLVLKGSAMGAADVIPGVSGGTIAFITGIFEELVNSIKKVDLKALKLLFTINFKEFWKHINGNFLISVVSGIAISIFSLAKLMTYLLETYPLQVWSFFFGLIIASSLLVSKEIKQWNATAIISLIIGIVAAYTITVLSPANTPETWWFIILSGALAVCAMILPGISGAFILLLLGKYEFILNAVKDFNIPILALFFVGIIIGITSFSRILSWMLKNYHTFTISLLTGFMIGSLNKIWPWKSINTELVNGNIINIEKNVLPGTYEQLSGLDPLIFQAILFCAFGFLLIWGIEKFANSIKK